MTPTEARTVARTILAIAQALRATRPGWSPHAEQTGAYGQRHTQWQQDVIAVRDRLCPTPTDRDRFNDATGLFDAGND